MQAATIKAAWYSQVGKAADVLIVGEIDVESTKEMPVISSPTLSPGSSNSLL